MKIYDAEVYVDEFCKLGTWTQCCHRFSVNDVSKFSLRRAAGEDLKTFEVDVYVDGLRKLETLKQNTVIALNWTKKEKKEINEVKNATDVL